MVRAHLRAIATLLAATSGTSHAKAQSQDLLRARLHLHWSGSARCRPTKDVVDGLHRLLGTDPNALLTEDLIVRALIEEEARGWKLELSASGPHGQMERSLEAATCADVGQAMSLVLSLWIQPALFAENQEIREAIHPHPLKKATQAEVPAEASQRRRIESRGEPRLGVHPRSFRVRPGRRLRVRGFLGLVAFSGALPGWGPGLTGGIGAILDTWSLDLSLLWLLPQRTIAGLPGVEAEFELLAPGIRAGRSWSIASNLNVQPAVWANVGRLHGEAAGEMSTSTPSDGWWGGAGLSSDVTLRIRRIIVSFGLGGGLPFGRPAFSVGGYRLYKTSAFVGFGGLAIGTTFP